MRTSLLVFLLVLLHACSVVEREASDQSLPDNSKVKIEAEGVSQSERKVVANADSRPSRSVTEGVLNTNAIDVAYGWVRALTSEKRPDLAQLTNDVFYASVVLPYGAVEGCYSKRDPRYEARASDAVELRAVVGCLRAGRVIVGVVRDVVAMHEAGGNPQFFIASRELVRMARTLLPALRFNEGDVFVSFEAYESGIHNAGVVVVRKSRIVGYVFEELSVDVD